MEQVEHLNLLKMLVNLNPDSDTQAAFDNDDDEPEPKPAPDPGVEFVILTSALMAFTTFTAFLIDHFIFIWLDLQN